MQMGGGATLRSQIGGHDLAPTATRERLTAGEIAYVAERRRSVRASWQACATILSRPVHDVRMACDAEYAAQFNRDRPLAMASRSYRPVLDDALGGPGKVLLALGSLERKFPSRSSAPRVSASAVAGTLGVGSVWVGQRLRRLESLGLVLGERAGRGSENKLWCLTDRGRAEVERLEPTQ